MGASSWRKAAPRREHKERSQPAARARKWSLLEKKKDYTLRARDYNAKQARLAVLRDKAASRNPDEFYFGMVRSTTSRGSGHRRLQGVGSGPYAEALPLASRSAEERILGDSADARYVGVKAAAEAAKVRRLGAALHFAAATGVNGAPSVAGKGAGAAPPKPRRRRRLAGADVDPADGAPTARHVLFVDDAEEVAAFDAATYFSTPPALLARTANRPRAADVAAGRVMLSTGGARSATAAAKAAARSYRELAVRADRVRKLERVRDDVELLKRLKGPGAKSKVRAHNPWTGAPAVYKWRQVRSK